LLRRLGVTLGDLTRDSWCEVLDRVPLFKRHAAAPAAQTG